jgi:hypothetical protein
MDLPRKMEYIKLEFFMDPDNSTWGSKYSRDFAIFKDGFPEDWIKWVISLREIEYLMPLKEPSYSSRKFRPFLKGQDLSYFENHSRRMLETKDSEVPDNQLIGLVITELYIGQEDIYKRAICVQNYYMRQTRILTQVVR